MSYEDNVLIKLQRRFKKDEVIVFLIKLVQQYKTENESLKRQLMESKAELRKPKTTDFNLIKDIAKLKKRIEKLRRLNEKLINRK